MRRKPLTVAAVAATIASVLIAPAAGAANDYPDRPITLLAPFAAGGSTDVLARIIAPELEKRLGQDVVVENRTGAGGSIGIGALARSAPDGYTIALASPGPIVVNVTLLKSLPYDPIRDLAPIALIADLPIVLVAHPSVAANNVSELIALERLQPGSFPFASAGTGTTMHLSGELLNRMAGTKLVHVPYKGTGLALTDVLGGHVPLGFLDLPAVASQWKAGAIRVLAVGNKRRTVTAPEVPTIGESVRGYETSGWFGVVAPAKTPPEIIARLNAEIVKIMKSPDVQNRILQVGIEPLSSTPEEFAEFIKAEIPKWAEVIKTADIEIQ